MDKGILSKIIKQQQAVSNDYRDFINLTSKAWEKHEQLRVHLKTLSILYDVLDINQNQGGVRISPFKIFIVCAALSKSAFGISADVTPCFSPRQHCTAALIDALSNAEKKIYIHAYSFTHPSIAAALVAARKRGVDVQVHMDKSRIAEKYSMLPLFIDEGISVSIQEMPPIAHNKIMIIDDDLVITGSFNWTKNAAKNEENLNFIRSKEIAEVYLENWERVTNK